ncbi:hypothetical protein DFJ77DRAFT_524625 [Powellomyces hirtus]|nr:hypothetical protein DFJ77DRAFT_524625 [Powellomyces hirtus]
MVLFKSLVTPMVMFMAAMPLVVSSAPSTEGNSLMARANNNAAPHVIVNPRPARKSVTKKPPAAKQPAGVRKPTAKKPAAKKNTAARKPAAKKPARKHGPNKPAAGRPRTNKETYEKLKAIKRKKPITKPIQRPVGQRHPAAKAPAAKKPVVKKPVANKPAPGRPRTNKEAYEKLKAIKRKKPITKPIRRPVGQKHPAAKAPAAKKPVAKKPVANKPAPGRPRTNKEAYEKLKAIKPKRPITKPIRRPVGQKHPAAKAPAAKKGPMKTVSKVVLAPKKPAPAKPKAKAPARKLVQMCNPAKLEDVQNMPGWFEMTEYVRGLYGKWNGMYVNWNMPKIPVLKAEVCTHGHLVNQKWNEAQCSPISQTCTTGCGNDGSVVGDQIDISIATQGMYSLSTSTTSSVAVGLGLKYSVTVGVPTVAQHTGEISTSIDYTHTSGETTTNTIMAMITQTVHKKIPPKGCGYQVKQDICTVSGTGELHFRAKGWVWFTFEKRKNGHYFWAFNIEKLMDPKKYKNMASTTLNLAVNANSASSIIEVCQSRKRDLSHTEFFAGANITKSISSINGTEPIFADPASVLERREADYADLSNGLAKRGIFPRNIGFTNIDGMEVAYAD